MAEGFPNRYKTMWEKDKLLVTSNLSFSHSVFKRLALQTRKNQGLFGKELSQSEVVLHSTLQLLLQYDFILCLIEINKIVTKWRLHGF